MISVVIPARDAAATLGRQLDALADPSFAEPWEIVVADNGSRDGTVALVEDFARRAARVSVRCIDAGDRPGAAHARNVGASAARGEKLVFVDADDEVAPGFLTAIDRALDEHPFVACRYDTRTLNPEAVHASLGDAQSSDLPVYDYPAFLPHAGGGGLAIRREHHDAIGGFDESYPALEDTDYCWRLQLAGVPLLFAGDAVVRIRLKTGTGAIFRQGQHFGIHNVRIYRDYRSHRERGMPYLGPLPGLKRWLVLALRTPFALWTAPARARWVWQLGWRIGRLRGCARYRVLAL